MNVGDHICDFGLEQFFRPEFLVVDNVNDLETVSFVVIRSRVELSYESKEFFFCNLNSFTVNIVHIIEFNDLNR